ncbi:hypothetical protein SARC_10519 [Sphaeroforma arctica JP610]|uniref:Uncharacterized protein n=1 Tax=Sphaeroforma arctica JP610 TaxID=667725 RepID=A0A0L0FJQ3_9EUKA|nr:hypothetical protein SARC_10519 [Sphaeroforma arctica JP610]KNC77009.1 hypothetical protein SARC_10519 [Sphaeroforma arctica JP610]|eukprot:XP_014150911.1 hypothetical protein SARC_10519 [Sphaeroforma arctica JP610]
MAVARGNSQPKRRRGPLVRSGDGSDASADDGAHTLEQSGWVQPDTDIKTNGSITKRAKVGRFGSAAGSVGVYSESDDGEDDEEPPDPADIKKHRTYKGRGTTDSSKVSEDAAIKRKHSTAVQSKDVFAGANSNGDKSEVIKESEKESSEDDVSGDSSNPEMEIEHEDDYDNNLDLESTSEGDQGGRAEISNEEEEVVDEEDDDDDDILDTSSIIEATDAKKSPKMRKRRVNFTPDMDNKLLSLILDVRPYLAARGYVARSWDEVSKKFNLSCGGDGRVQSTQDTCKNRFQNVLDKYNANGKLSGSIAEVAERRRLLVAISADMANEKGIEREGALEAGVSDRILSQNTSVDYRIDDELTEQTADSSADRGIQSKTEDNTEREVGTDDSENSMQLEPALSASGIPFGKNVTLTTTVGGTRRKKSAKRRRAHLHAHAYAYVPTSSHTQVQAQAQAQAQTEEQAKGQGSNLNLKWHSHSHSPSGGSKKSGQAGTAGAYGDRNDPGSHAKNSRGANGDIAYAGDRRGEKRMRYTVAKVKGTNLDNTGGSEVYRDGGRISVVHSPSGRATNEDLVSDSGRNVRRKSTENEYDASERKYTDRKAERELRKRMFDKSRWDVEQRFAEEIVERQKDRALRTKAVKLDHELRLREIVAREREADNLEAMRVSMDRFSERLSAIERRLGNEAKKDDV